MSRKHTSDYIRRLVFEDLKNGMSIKELHIKYGINKKTLQSLKEQRQDVGRFVKAYFIRKVPSILRIEKNTKKLLCTCKKEIRKMISFPDHELQCLLKHYNSRRKIKLTRSNRKIVDWIADQIVGIAAGVNQWSPCGFINYNQSDDLDYAHSFVNAPYHFIDNTNYLQDEESIHLIQGISIGDESFIDSALFGSSSLQRSTQLLSNSNDSFNVIDDAQRIIQQQEDYQNDESRPISSSNETVRRSKRIQKIQPSE